MIDWKNAEWDTTVCHCLKLDKQTVVTAILEGADTVPALERKLNSGTGCGTCIPNIQELIKIYGSSNDGPSCCGSGHCC